MTIIKRCEKEVQGTWADKQLQAATWLDHFVPHYSGRCVPVVDHQCPAKHTPAVDASKNWLDGEHPADKVKVAALLQLIGRMKADVTLYIHGYNTCAVECAHGERTVLTSKRIEYWTNWEGKCRLVQLLHNHRTRATGESLLQSLGWQVTDGVSDSAPKHRPRQGEAPTDQDVPCIQWQEESHPRREEDEGCNGSGADRTCSGAEAEDAREAAALLQR